MALGTGMAHWKKLLAAAAKSGVKHCFLEDENPKAVEQIPASVKHLDSLK